MLERDNNAVHFRRVETVDEILDVPAPSAAIRGQAFEAMLVAVSRKQWSRRLTVTTTIACIVLAAIFGFDRERGGSEAVAPARSYDLVTTHNSGFTVVRSQPVAAVTIVESKPSVEVDRIDTSALLAMFPETASVLVSGDGHSRPKLIVAQIADNRTLRDLAEPHAQVSDP